MSNQMVQLLHGDLGSARPHPPRLRASPLGRGLEPDLPQLDTWGLAVLPGLDGAHSAGNDPSPLPAIHSSVGTLLGGNSQS